MWHDVYSSNVPFSTCYSKEFPSFLVRPEFKTNAASGPPRLRAARRLCPGSPREGGAPGAFATYSFFGIEKRDRSSTFSACRRSVCWSTMKSPFTIPIVPSTTSLGRLLWINACMMLVLAAGSSTTSILDCTLPSSPSSPTPSLIATWGISSTERSSSRSYIVMLPSVDATLSSPQLEYFLRYRRSPVFRRPTFLWDGAFDRLILLFTVYSVCGKTTICIIDAKNISMHIR
mmetsp:Transcript_35517/g.69919  ORF Transcript_35517/g.69919 Transcript_35517/m.69919 type:complete len:231 (+) Transcript_35517:409-1101(+)